MQTHFTLRFLGLGALLTASSLSLAAAQTAPCWNYGSLGPAADGVHMGNVLLGTPSLLGDPGDGSVQYPNPVSGGAADSTTRLPYRPELNPPSNQPFTVEFWAEPWVNATSGAGPCPLFNRQSAGNRSGWIWFQRAPGAGWNFAMYSGVGSSIGINLTGGTATAFTLNHLVATWDGVTATLYHNGNVVGSGSGPFAANQAGVTLSVGGYDNGENGYQGVVDDLAIYDVALSASEVDALYTLGASTQPNLHGMTVINGGALLYWRNLAAESIGARYCNPSVSNSLGFRAALDANGARAAAANDVTLIATLLPTNIFGFFLGSQTQGLVGQPGGSEGVLCLGGLIGRYVAPTQIKNSGAGGSFELVLDLNQTPAGPVFAAIAAGETWNFQAWYRDSTGGLPSSNFSDAVSITFE